MIELNLLPDVKKEFISAQRTRNTVISLSILVTIAAGAVTLILALSVYGGQNAYMALQSTNIKKKAAELQKKPEINKYLTVQNQLKNIDSLHSSKEIYSQLFGYLQSLNPAAPNNIALSSVKVAKDDSSIELMGSVRDFAALTVFKTTLESASLKYNEGDSQDTTTTKLFDSVTLAEAGLKNTESGAVVNFTIRLAYPEVIFAPTTKSPQVIVPSKITSDADRNAPTEIFGTNPGGTQ
jgi:hypothetical protein